jgi:hypothetical protein
MFTTYCVAFCIIVAILVIGFVFSWLVGLTNNDDIDENIFFAWILSSIGFGVCLTYILFNHGII